MVRNSINSINRGIRSKRGPERILRYRKAGRKPSQRPVRFEAPPEPYYSHAGCLNLDAGLYKKAYEGYFDGHNEFFDSEPVLTYEYAQTYIDDFYDQQNNTSVIIKGYFKPIVNGVYKFRLSSDIDTYLWLGENALDGNRIALANELGGSPNSTLSQPGIHELSYSESVQFTMTANSYYPLTVELGVAPSQDEGTIVLLCMPPGSNEWTSDLTDYLFYDVDSKGHRICPPSACVDNWTLVNFDGTTFRNGDPIPQIEDATDWANATGPAWCYYDNNPANGPKYGKLYNRAAVTDARELAPEGYYVPSLAEWQTLIDCLGGISVAGEKMKTTRTTSDNNGLWTSPNIASNESQFSVVPGGVRAGGFVKLHERGGFWVSDSDTCVNFNYDAAGIYIGLDSAANGYSIRLIQGTPPPPPPPPPAAYLGKVLSLDAVPYDRNPNQIIFDNAGVPTVNGTYVYTQTGSPIIGSMFHNTGFYGPVVSGKNNFVEFDVQYGKTGYFVGDWIENDWTYFNTGNISFINRIEVNESIFNVSGVYTRLNSGDNAFTIDGLSRKIIKNQNSGWDLRDDSNITRYTNYDINLDPNLWYTSPLGTKTDGLLGIQYSGYFDNDPTWFNTATVQPIITGLTLTGAAENDANGTYINSNYLNQGTYRFDVIPDPEFNNEGSYIIFNPNNQITGERYWGLYVIGLERIQYKSYDLINWTDIFDEYPEYAPKVQSLNTINSENSTLFSTSRSVMNGTSWEWVGYFRPQNTSNHSFNMYADENAYFWIGDKALNGYTTGNADMFSSQYIQATVTNLALVSGVNYPVRMQWGHPANPTNAGLSLGYNDGINAGNNFSGLFFNFTGSETSEKHFPQSILITGAGTSYYNDIYTSSATGRGDFIAKIVITGAGQPSSNGVYTRVNSGDNFIGPNGNYIDDSALYDNTVKAYTYDHNANFQGWNAQGFAGYIDLNNGDGDFNGRYSRSTFGYSTFNGPNGNTIVWNNSLNRWELISGPGIGPQSYGLIGYTVNLEFWTWEVDIGSPGINVDNNDFGDSPISLNLPNTTYYGQNDPDNVLFWLGRWILSNISKQNWIGDEPVGYYLCNGPAGDSYSNDLIFDDKHWEPDVASYPRPTGSFVANPNFNSINSNRYSYDFTLGQWQVTNPAYEIVPDVYYSHVWLDSISGFVNAGIVYSGNKHVTLVNNPTYSSDYNGVYSFNGVDQYAMTQEVPQSTDGSVSHFTWFKPTGAGVVVDELGQPGLFGGWHDSQLEVTQDGKVNFGIWGDYRVNSTFKIQSTGSIDLDRWYHLGLTYSSGVLSAYINGEKIADSNCQRMNGPTNLYYAICGGDSTNMGEGGFGKGSVGSFQVYNKALTTGEVNNLYNNEKDRFSIPKNGLSLWLKADAGVILNNSNVSVWQDQSNNGNNAVAKDGEVTVVENSLNGRPVLRFDGSSNLITNSFYPTNYNTPITIIAVSRASASDVRNSETARYVQTVNDRFDWDFGLTYGGYETENPNFSVCYGKSYAGSDDIESSPMGENAIGLSIAINDGSTISNYLNGTLIGTANSSVWNNGGDAVGSFSIGSEVLQIPKAEGFFAKCDIAEIIIYKRALTTLERQEVENYLSNKYAISL